jgi:hypothetical protein
MTFAMKGCGKEQQSPSLSWLKMEYKLEALLPDLTSLVFNTYCVNDNIPNNNVWIYCFNFTDVTIPSKASPCVFVDTKKFKRNKYSCGIQ